MKILYIMGRGHSGSTVLDLILGNHPDIQSVGELNAGFRRGPEEVCSCGKHLPDCEFWMPIRKDLDERFPDVKSHGYARMLRYLDNFHRMPQILSRLFLPKWVEKQYLPITHHLFESIAEAGHARLVLDSSKEFSRAAFFLSRFQDARVIYLVRDGRGTLWSFLKRVRKGWTFNFMRGEQKFKRAWPVMTFLVLSFVVGEMLARTLKVFYGRRILTVRYEDVCETPTEELARIGEFIGVGMEEIARKIEAKQPLKIGHNVGGNIMCHGDDDDFVFVPDGAWRDKLPLGYGRLYLLLGFVHAWSHGYR